MELAVNKFIESNYTNMMNPLLNARNENGKKLHTHQSASDEVKQRLMNYKK
jgi:hypothetical protein